MTPSPSTREIVSLVGVVALLAHQVLRRYEPRTPLHHASCLLLAPTTISVAIILNPQCTRTLVHTFLLVFPLYISTLVVSIVIYRLSPFHPLARYPGPIPARVSMFWMAVVSTSGDQHKYIKSLHDRYGDVVRTGPNELSVRDPSLVPEILGSSGLPKGPHFHGRMLQYEPRMLVAVSDIEEHARRRRPWLRGFAPAAVKEYDALIAQRASQMRSALEEQKGVVQLGEWIDFFAYDFMTDMAFGGGSELLSGQGKDNFWAVLDAHSRMATFLGRLPWLGILLGYVPAASKPVALLINRCAEFTAARVKRGASKLDLFHYLSGEDDPSRPQAPASQLIDDGVLAIVAGADTTASATTSTFACLLAHPEVYVRLQQEVDRFYPPGADPADSRHHKEMPYLNAVINEGLRLFPPVPGGTQRMEPADGQGSTFSSMYVPPGTNVWVHTWSLHRDPRNFRPHPNGFWPERWLLAADPDLDSAGTAKVEGAFTHNAGAFVPFSYGPMNCVGRALAVQEMGTLLCTVLQRFEVRAAPGATVDGREGGVFDLHAYEERYKDFFTTSRAAVPVVLEARRGRE
ncbi:high nitrogen upregulated cytochrome P450 monooxygenase 2 [Epithele typhae]|uniref:high nitrogen upregulated cytochrome P450 monooxygenase 2 n=1 Tax=Epithele typhae TaxID=378194 RepID=UPI002007BFF2|nr:high nitrogen upregulated cytochrome P450 monooxygenase 2 [Epithele typhae]KAH9940216.1 high nitrogen upregulated cytochrome P450 monooxygenase 2 [Epithele typhae]